MNILEAKNEIKKIKEENILKKEEIGISETASENKKRRGRPTVYQRDHIHEACVLFRYHLSCPIRL